MATLAAIAGGAGCHGPVLLFVSELDPLPVGTDVTRRRRANAATGRADESAPATADCPYPGIPEAVISKQ
jgi:hypothetical protein